MKASILVAAGVLSTAIAGPVVEKRQSNSKTPPVSVKGNGEHSKHVLVKAKLIVW